MHAADKKEVLSFLHQTHTHLSLPERRRIAKTFRAMADDVEEGQSGAYSVLTMAAVVATEFATRELLSFRAG
jgi:hypothetical protein